MWEPLCPKGAGGEPGVSPLSHRRYQGARPDGRVWRLFFGSKLKTSSSRRHIKRWQRLWRKERGHTYVCIYSLCMSIPSVMWCFLQLVPGLQLPRLIFGIALFPPSFPLVIQDIALFLWHPQSGNQLALICSNPEAQKTKQSNNWTHKTLLFWLAVCLTGRWSQGFSDWSGNREVESKVEWRRGQCRIE